MPLFLSAPPARWLLAAFFLLLLAGGCAAPVSREPSVKIAIRDFPKWERVRDLEKNNPSFAGNGPTMPDAMKAAAWQRLRETLPEEPLMAKLDAVNAFFNQWPYARDDALWGIEDYWAVPREFVLWSGDCEDYAITKYYALRFFGVPARDMRIAVVWNEKRDEGHAVLLVFVEGKAYLLDNFSDKVTPREKLLHYTPVFHVNEEALWLPDTE